MESNIYDAMPAQYRLDVETKIAQLQPVAVYIHRHLQDMCASSRYEIQGFPIKLSLFSHEFVTFPFQFVTCSYDIVTFSFQYAIQSFEFVSIYSSIVFNHTEYLGIRPRRAF